MSLDELRTICQNEERGALGYLGGALSEERKKSYRYYLGQPFGNEIDGRSQVVSTDVADTVEWILPSLIRVFMAGDDVVEFQPQGPEDEKLAKQASEYCNWIFTRDNPGFVTLYESFKDALLARTGIIKVWWDPTPQYRTQRYYNIPDDSFQILQMNAESGEYEIVEDTPGKPNAIQQIIMGPDGQPQPTTVEEPTHNVVIRKTSQSGCTRIAAVPPEEFLISRNARTVKEAVYIGHRRLRTQSSLVEDGYDLEMVQGLGAGEQDLTGEEITRRMDIDEQRIGSPGAASDNTTREIWVTESYVLADYNGDGVAERLKVTHAGFGSTAILTRGGKPDVEEWDGPLPFAVGTPILMPHRVVGRSVSDLVMDIQLIKSTLMRQMLDGLYLANDPRSVVNPDNVELDDLLDSRPGGVIRTKNGMAPEGQVVPLITPFVGEAAFQGLEYMDTVRENRTGVTKYNQGLDANSLNKTATGITQIMTSAQQRVELIARVFAETQVKHLFKLILWNVCKYQDKPRVIRLRNEWVPMDPREWDEGMDVTINVGVGTGNRDQVLAHLNMLTQIQNLIVQAQQGPGGPVVTFQQIFNLANKIAENAGFKNPEQFFADPQNAPPQQPKPDPNMVKAQGQLQIQQQKAQSDAQLAQQQQVQDAQSQQMEAHNDAQIAAARLQMEWQLKQAEMAAEHQLAQQKLQNDMELAQRKLQADTAIKAASAKMQADIAEKTAKAKANAAG